MFLTQSLLRLFFILGFTLLCGCSIYKSPDRKDFDLLVVAQNLANLKVTGCSAASVREFATEAKLISRGPPPLNNFLWQYKINDTYIIESDTFEGVYCLYENI